MATTARDEIIADWRKHLADAQQPLSPHSPRTAWLTRLKLRLYRFLLSLYGDGRWNASDSTAQEITDTGRIVIHHDAMPFSGKPAKDEKQIRDALQSVAEASYGRSQAGPLVGMKQRDLIPVQVFNERTQLQGTGLRKTGRGGALISYVCLAAMVATVFVLTIVPILGVAVQTTRMSPTIQVLLRQTAVVTLACFVISAMMYGIFAVSPRK